MKLTLFSSADFDTNENKSTQTCTQDNPVKTLMAKTLPPKAQPKLVPNITQYKHQTLVPKLYHPRFNPNLYPS